MVEQEKNYYAPEEGTPIPVPESKVDYYIDALREEKKLELQKELEDKLSEGHISDAQEIIDFTQENGIELEAPSVCQKGLEERLSQGYISDTQEIITFAQKNGIQFEVSSACQKGLEERLSQGYISAAQKIISFTQENGIQLEVSSACQKGLEESLSRGYISDAQKIITLAQENGIEIDLQKEEVSSACQKGLEESLSRGYISDTQEIITFAQENGIEVDLDLVWQKVRDKVKEEFNLSSKEVQLLSKQEILSLLYIINEEDEEDEEGLGRNEVWEFLSKRERIIEEKSKNFPIGKEYERYFVSGLKRKENPYRAVILLIKGLISRQEELLNEVYRVFEEEKIKAARELLGGLKGQGIINPSDIFKSIFQKTKIAKILDNPDDYQRIDEEQLRITYDIVIDSLKEIIEKCKEKGIASPKLEPLSDLIASCEGIKRELSSFDVVVFKNQEVSVSDFFDNRTTLCCAFFPNGVNSGASISYVEDPYINLLWAKAAEAGSEGKVEEIENVGVAICCLCQDSEGRKVLLVDSVEGGEDFQRAGSERKLFTLFLSAIEKLARDTDCDYIIFNSSVYYNQTPRNFISFLSNRGLEEKRVYLEKMGEKEEDYYFEAFGEWKKPKGEVTGIIMKIKKEGEKDNKPELNFEIVNSDSINNELLESLLVIEQISFPESLQSDKEDLSTTIRNRKGVNIVIRSKEARPLGYFSSLPLSDIYQELKEHDKALKKEKGVLYAESIAFLPEIRGGLIFKKLFQLIINTAKKKGYKKIVAHVRVKNGFSERLQNMGAKKIRRINNWLGSGEPFDYLEIEL